MYVLKAMWNYKLTFLLFIVGCIYLYNPPLVVFNTAVSTIFGGFFMFVAGIQFMLTATSRVFEAYERLIKDYRDLVDGAIERLNNGGR